MGTTCLRSRLTTPKTATRRTVACHEHTRPAKGIGRRSGRDRCQIGRLSAPSCLAQDGAATLALLSGRASGALQVGPRRLLHVGARMFWLSWGRPAAEYFRSTLCGPEPLRPCGRADRGAIAIRHRAAGAANLLRERQSAAQLRSSALLVVQPSPGCPMRSLAGVRSATSGRDRRGGISMRCFVVWLRRPVACQRRSARRSWRADDK
mmetsp:Transcript_62390/g.122728  ORF Transcript_62390/g.122728 Transcript_62390/m.122728 type:complete len:207 (-) Transcript_62390:47-667(-)